MGTKDKKKFYIKGKLIGYDLAVYLMVVLLLLEKKGA